MKFFNPCLDKEKRSESISGLLNKGIRGLEISSVNGNNRVALPPIGRITSRLSVEYFELKLLFKILNRN